MPGRRHVGAFAALPILALSGCVPPPEVVVRTQTLVCPASRPAALPCPVEVEGDTLGAVVETLRERGACLQDGLDAWEAVYAACRSDIAP